jgi:DNA polymerase IV
MTAGGGHDTWVGHADVDAFYASVEQRDNPAYRGRPVVVGAQPGGRGVVAAASYEARTFGIRSAMPIDEAARRCPHAVFLRPDMARYARVSAEIFAVFASVTPVVEPVSIDEAYLDLGGLRRLFGPPDAIGHLVRERVREATGLTVSVGIGPNRLIAKLASEHGKPDGMCVVPPERVTAFLDPMPVGNLRGLGRQTQRVFDRLGIETVAQLRAMPRAYLVQHLGAQLADRFRAQAHGIASSAVTPSQRRKQVSAETTFATDVDDSSRLSGTLQTLAARVAATVRAEGLAGRTVTLKVRYAGFETHTRQRRLAAPTRDERELFRVARDLLNGPDLPRRPVRLVGVGLGDWADPGADQGDLFDGPRERARDDRLLQAIDRANARFGRGTLRIGRDD